MSNGDINYAIHRSTNTVNFQAPYGGVQYAWLQLSKHPRHGQDVILWLQKAQFLCDFRGCEVLVRFDDSTARIYAANEPEDRRKTLLIIRDTQNFLTHVRKAKKVFIQATFFQEAPQVFEFDVADLKW
jgi:hypothetical protein